MRGAIPGSSNHIFLARKCGLTRCVGAPCVGNKRILSMIVIYVDINSTGLFCASYQNFIYGPGASAHIRRLSFLRNLGSILHNERVLLSIAIDKRRGISSFQRWREFRRLSVAKMNSSDASSIATSD